MRGSPRNDLAGPGVPGPQNACDYDRRRRRAMNEEPDMAKKSRKKKARKKRAANHGKRPNS